MEESKECPHQRPKETVRSRILTKSPSDLLLSLDATVHLDGNVVCEGNVGVKLKLWSLFPHSVNLYLQYNQMI